MDENVKTDRIVENEEKDNTGNEPSNKDLANEITTELKKFFTLDILNYIRRPWKLIGLNFLMGLVRGIGFFLGMTIVGAIVFKLLLNFFNTLTRSNIPLISEWLARLVALVQANLQVIR